MGPLNEAMKEEMLARQGDIRFDIEWTTLGEYLDYLVERGVSTNVASFIGATTPRKYVLGHEDRPPTAEELETMQEIVREAMREGAMGVASSLMYPPGLFADTDELIALSAAAAEFDGMYISHMRDEGAHMLEAVEELITIAREAGIRAEIYHIKSSGKPNWPGSRPPPRWSATRPRSTGPSRPGGRRTRSSDASAPTPPRPSTGWPRSATSPSTRSSRGPGLCC